MPLDVAEWLSADGEKELDELLISLGFTLGAMVIATVVGMAVTALIVGATGFALAPAAIAVAGFAIVAVVGIGIGYVINTSGVKEKALQAFREWSASTTINQPDFQNSDLYQGMMVAP